MNKHIVQGSLREWKGKIQQAWSRLTDSDLDRLEGSWDELAGKIQKTYGYTKEEAVDEVERFRQRNEKNDYQASSSKRNEVEDDDLLVD
jgi:uncharacterized protein YjbJ (UPF0337 family)